MRFVYDDGGHRVQKIAYTASGAIEAVTYYFRDAQGNALGVYTQTGTTGPLQLKEHTVYSSGRLGLYYRHENRYSYELKDHLGNVRAVVNRRVVDETDPPTDAQPILAYLADYYPFGWLMPDRKVLEYRYGYQGNEEDPETGWTAFQLRMYDGRVGRWMSVDPKKEFHSPYLAMGNTPASTTDPDGGTTSTWLVTDSGRRRYINDGSDKIIKISEAQFNNWITFSDFEVMKFKSEGYRGSAIGTYNLNNPGDQTKLPPYKGYTFPVDKPLPVTGNPLPSDVVDFVGIQIDINTVGLAPAWIVPTGFGFVLSTGIGYIKGDGLNVYSSAGYAWGFDVSAGISLATGKYSGVDRPTWENWAGTDKVHSLGTPVLDVQVSRDFDSASQQVGTNWTNLNIGLKTKSLLPFSYYYGTTSSVAWF